MFCANRCLYIRYSITLISSADFINLFVYYQGSELGKFL